MEIKSFCEKNKFKQAISTGLETIRLSNDLFGPKTQNKIKTIQAFLQIYFIQAQMYFSENKFLETERCYKLMKQIIEKHLGKDHQELARIYLYSGQLYENNSRYIQAAENYESALSFLKKENLPLSDIIDGYHQISAYYFQRQQYDKAEPLLKKCLHFYEKQTITNYQRITDVYIKLARIYQKQQKNDQLESAYLKILQIDMKQFGENHPETAKDLKKTGIHYMNVHSYEKAEKYFLRSLKIFEIESMQSHPDYLKLLNHLSALYKKTQNEKKYLNIQNKIRNNMIEKPISKLF